MNKKPNDSRIVFIIFTLVCVGAVVLGGFASMRQRAEEVYLKEQQQHSYFFLGQNKLIVEVATTPEQKAQGLSGRNEIGSDGMLFLFPGGQEVRFWMKDMQFALDFIWIRDEQVVAITENVLAPDPSQRLHELPVIQPAPNQKVDAVLEVPAGYVQRNAVQIGQTAKLLGS